MGPERAVWTEGRSAVLRGAVLGLLVGREEPVHGYMLGTLLDRHLGAAWQLNPKNIYALLDGLERDGLVVSEPRADQRGKAYRATGQAEAALDEWMHASVEAVPRRVELQARIAVSREQDIPDLRRALGEYERHCFQLLTRTNPEGDVPVVSWRAVAINLTRQAELLHLRAELDWIEEARRWISDWQQNGPPGHAAGGTR